MARRKAKMGNAQTLPLKYGEQGEGGAVLGLSTVSSSTPPLLLSASKGGVATYNYLSGDRTMFSPSAAPLTSAAHCPNLSLFAVGLGSGEVQLLSVVTLQALRVVPAPAAAPCSVTALAFSPPSALFVGYSTGEVRCVCAETGAVQGTLPPPAPPPAPHAAQDPPLSVNAIALCIAPPPPSEVARAGPPSPPVLLLLAVGHANGTVVLHEPPAGGTSPSAPSAPLSFPPPSPPLLTSPLSGLLYLRSLNCLAAYSSGCNTLVLLDVAKGRVVALDFSAELQSVNRGFAQLSTAVWDDARGCMLVGGRDGAVYTRSITRIAGTGDVAVKLLRVAPPTAGSAAPAPITTLLYHSKADSALVGDGSGLVRRLKKVAA